MKIERRRSNGARALHHARLWALRVDAAYAFSPAAAGQHNLGNRLMMNRTWYFLAVLAIATPLALSACQTHEGTGDEHAGEEVSGDEHAGDGAE